MAKIASSYKILIFVIVLCAFGQKSLAQEPTATGLLSYLKFLETEYDIRFSYVQEDLDGIKIIPLKDDKPSIENILSYLQQNTQFDFHQIDERYVTVIAKSDNPALCGRIIDLETQIPLEGAGIFFEKASFNTTSNPDGYFYVPKDAQDMEFTVFYLGYASLTNTTSALSENCPDLQLKPSISELEPVMVQNIFTQGIYKNMDGSILLSTKNFGLLPGQVENDVLQIAQALPGVESVDETISNINIRGGTHDENLLLWDDIKMYQSGHFFGLISAFNPDITQNVTIYKNGTNVRYGEGVSGIMDMRSKNTISSETDALIGFNLINGNGFLDMPLSKKMSLQVAARKSINHLWESPVYKNYTKRIFQDSEISNVENNENSSPLNAHETFSFYDFSTKLLWDISEKDKFRVNFLTIDNSLDFTETLENTSQSKTSELKQSSLLGGISWNRFWNKNITTNALVYGTYYLLDAIHKDVFTTQEQAQQNEVLETGVKLDATLVISESINIQTGYHFSETGIANTQEVNLPRFRDYEKNVLLSHAFFAGIHYSSKNQKSFITAGARGNYFTKLDEFIIEPRLSFHQKFGNGFAFEALGEFKSQSATQRIDFESDFLGIEKRRWVLADGQNIPIMESKQASAGFVYSKNALFMNVEGFYKIVDHINIANQGLQNQYQFSNSLGKYRVKGVELVINKKINSFSTWLSYIYSKNDYEFENLEASSFPNNLDIRHSANLAGTYSFNSIKIAFGLNWHSGKPYTILMENNETSTEGGITTINYDTPHAERLPDYFRSDLSAEYLWELSPSIDAQINVAVLNLFNSENIINIHYALARNENNEIVVNKIEEASLGLTPNLSIQVTF